MLEVKYPDLLLELASGAITDEIRQQMHNICQEVLNLQK
jgi:hypothetical protein